MLTGVSSATRGSTQSAIAIAVPLVLERANLQPVLPVQAMSPARTLVALAVSPMSPRHCSTSAALSSAMPDISRFCQTVRRISPSPRSRAILARPRICSAVSLPTGSATPAHILPGCFWAWKPMCAWRFWRLGAGTLSAARGTRLGPRLASTAPSKLSQPPASRAYLRAAVFRAVPAPLAGAVAGGGGAGDVADVAGPGPFGGDAGPRQPLDQGNGSVRHHISYLQIRARRHVRVAPAVRLRQVGDAGQLPVRENAVGDAQ